MRWACLRTSCGAANSATAPACHRCGQGKPGGSELSRAEKLYGEWYTVGAKAAWPWNARKSEQAKDKDKASTVREQPKNVVVGSDGTLFNKLGEPLSDDLQKVEVQRSVETLADEGSCVPLRSPF